MKDARPFGDEEPDHNNRYNFEVDFYDQGLSRSLSAAFVFFFRPLGIKKNPNRVEDQLVTTRAGKSPFTGQLPGGDGTKVPSPRTTRLGGYGSPLREARPKGLPRGGRHLSALSASDMQKCLRGRSGGKVADDEILRRYAPQDDKGSSSE